MSIRDVIRDKGRRRIETINGFEPVRSAALKMRTKDVTALLLTERTMIRGILSEHEIVRAISVHGAAGIFMNARDVMVGDIRTVALSDSCTRALRLMTHNRVRHLLVTDDEVVVGLISLDELASHELDPLALEPTLFARSNSAAA